MVCVRMRRSEMQVLSVKFWRCSPISAHAQGARSCPTRERCRARARGGCRRYPRLPHLSALAPVVLGLGPGVVHHLAQQLVKLLQNGRAEPFACVSMQSMETPLLLSWAASIALHLSLLPVVGPFELAQTHKQRKGVLGSRRGPIG